MRGGNQSHEGVALAANGGFDGRGKNSQGRERAKQQLDDRADVSNADLELERRRTVAAREELTERAGSSQTDASGARRCSETSRRSSTCISAVSTNFADAPSAGAGHRRTSSKRKSGDVSAAAEAAEDKPAKRPRSSEEDEEVEDKENKAIGSHMDFRPPEMLPTNTAPTLGEKVESVQMLFPWMSQSTRNRTAVPVPRRPQRRTGCAQRSSPSLEKSRQRQSQRERAKRQPQQGHQSHAARDRLWQREGKVTY